jgi:hypothetical protein
MKKPPVKYRRFLPDLFHQVIPPKIVGFIKPGRRHLFLLLIKLCGETGISQPFSSAKGDDRHNGCRNAYIE